MTISVSTVNARNRLSDLINRVAYGKERVILNRRGRALVGIVPLEDMRLLEELEDRLDLDEARAALKEASENGMVAWDSLKEELDL